MRTRGKGMYFCFAVFFMAAVVTFLNLPNSLHKSGLSLFFAQTQPWIYFASDGEFSLRYTIFGKGTTRLYEPRRVCDLRVSPDYAPLSTWERFLVFFRLRPRTKGKWEPGPWGGPLAFDTDKGTVRFGAGLTEARDLLPHLLRRLSSDDPTPAGNRA